MSRGRGAKEYRRKKWIQDAEAVEQERDQLRQKLGEAQERIEELEAENRELLKDRERLEWLVRKGYAVRDSGIGEGLQIICSDSFSAVSETITINWRYAIDQAMGVGGKR